MTAIETVILVNENDEPQGIAEKMQAHREGLLHRAFSILLYKKTAAGFEFLLQRRALHKYHSPGLWSNTCCSHPRPHESTQDAAHRRLEEELGLKANLQEIGSFIYKAELENQLIEHEFDHVFIGEIQSEFNIQANPEEIAEIQWINASELTQLMRVHPKNYTAWLASVLAMTLNFLNLSSV